MSTTNGTTIDKPAPWMPTSSTPIQDRPSVWGEPVQRASYPYIFRSVLHCPNIVGGTPSDPKVAEGWIRTRLADKPEDLITEQVAMVMAERGLSENEAVKEVDNLRHLNGFRKDERGLYIAGYQVKAMLKEAVSVAVNMDKIPAGKIWGGQNKSLHKTIMHWLPEHVFVPETKVYLRGHTLPDDIRQGFVKTYRGTGIKYEEICYDVELVFHVETDYNFTKKDWGMLWTTAERQGIGASRSQGFGRFRQVEWAPIDHLPDDII